MKRDVFSIADIQNHAKTRCVATQLSRIYLVVDVF